MSKLKVLAELRQLTGSLPLTSKECWGAPQLLSGVPKGCLVELLGNARTEWIFSLFLLHPKTLIFWCEIEPHVNPTAIYQRGIGLDRIKFVNTKGDIQQLLRLALDSQHYAFIIAPQRFEEIKIFQRFQLLTEKAKSTLFFLPKEKFSTAWPITLQLEINRMEKGFDINIHKQRHGTLL